MLGYATHIAWTYFFFFSAISHNFFSTFSHFLVTCDVVEICIRLTRTSCTLLQSLQYHKNQIFSFVFSTKKKMRKEKKSEERRKLEKQQKNKKKTPCHWNHLGVLLWLKVSIYSNNSRREPKRKKKKHFRLQLNCIYNI